MKSVNRKLLSELLTLCEKECITSTYIYDFLKDCTNGFSNTLVSAAIDETQLYFKKVVEEYIYALYSNSSSNKFELDDYFSSELENDFNSFVKSGFINPNNDKLIFFLDKFLGFKIILSILRSESDTISVNDSICSVNDTICIEEPLTEINPVKGLKYALDNTKANNYIDIDALKEYFVPEFKQGNNSIPSSFDNFVNDLRGGLPSYSQNDITAIASIIYNSGKIHRSKKNRTFRGWLKEFATIINRITPKSKEGQLTDLIADLSNRFHYFRKFT